MIRPEYPDLTNVECSWPAEGFLVDATVCKNLALEVFQPGTTVKTAMSEMGLNADPLGSGHCLTRAGVLIKKEDGWSVRPMTQRERWVWRIPMDLYNCEPDDLQRIKGIGPSLAERIYRFVQGRGTMESLAELINVPGVGPGKLSALEKELALN